MQHHRGRIVPCTLHQGGHGDAVHQTTDDEVVPEGVPEETPSRVNPTGLERYFGQDIEGIFVDPLLTVQRIHFSSEGEMRSTSLS